MSKTGSALVVLVNDEFGRDVEALASSDLQVKSGRMVNSASETQVIVGSDGRARSRSVNVTHRKCYRLNHALTLPATTRTTVRG